MKHVWIGSRATRAAVRKVLNEAAEAPHFFDFSDAERLSWMIGRGYELGRRGRAPAARRNRRRKPTSKRKEGGR